MTRTFTQADTGGELDHKQTLAELARHKHKVMDAIGGGRADLQDDAPYIEANFIEPTGDSQPFNVL